MTDQIDANVSTTEEQQQPVAPAADAAPTQQAETERVFTQKELEQQLSERLKRERAKYADYDALKEAAAKLQELEDAQKSEQQKLQEKLERLEAEYQTERSKRREVALQARVANIAGSLGALDTFDANFRMATSAIDPDGDGADDEIKQKLEEIKAAKPYLFGKPGQRLEAFNPAEGGGAGAGETPLQRRNRIAGGGGMIWDTDPAKHGGGVVFSPGWDKST